jgi:hypothetical protein
LVFDLGFVCLSYVWLDYSVADRVLAAVLRTGMRDFKTPLHALVYFADCSAATCEVIALKKALNKSEFDRHVQITRQLIHQLRYFQAEPASINMVENRLLEALTTQGKKIKPQTLATHHADLINRVYGPAETLNWECTNLVAHLRDVTKQEWEGFDHLITFKDGSKVKAKYGQGAQGVTLEVL